MEKRNFFNKHAKAIYFSHDSNARNDDKILQLRVKYGWQGYGQFWAIIEHLASAKDYKLKLDFILGLALDLKIDVDVLKEFITYCVEIKLLKSNKKYFWSQSLIDRMVQYNQLREKRSKAGAKGARERWQNHSVDPVEDRFMTVENDN